MVPAVRLPWRMAAASDVAPSPAATLPAGGDAAAPAPRYVSQCPLDFTPEDVPSDGVYGIRRVARHPQLWSLGLVGLGAALGAAAAPRVVFFGYPLLFALVGGAHIDSRHRRGSGGVLPPNLEARTSHVPFAALLAGRQSWKQLGAELKTNNAGLALGLALLLAMGRRRRLSRLPALTRQ